MTISYIHFKTKEDFFESLNEAVESGDDLDIVFRRLIASISIQGSFNVNDVALILLLGAPKFCCQGEVTRDEQTQNTQLDEVDEESKSLEYLAARSIIDGQRLSKEQRFLIPKYSSLMVSAWGVHALRHAAIIPKIFSDDPFEYLSSFFSKHEYQRNSPYIGELSVHWENCIESIISKNPDSEMQTLKTVTAYYLGNKPINNLQVKDLTSTLDSKAGLEVDKPIIDPEICVYVQTVLYATYQWVDHGFTTGFEPEDIDDFYRRLSFIVRQINKNKRFYAVWESADYLKLKNDMDIHMMFYIKDYPYIYENMDAKLNRSVANDLLSELVSFEISQGFRGSSLSFTDSPLYEFKLSNAHIYEDLGEAFGLSGDRLVLDWVDSNDLKNVLESLLTYGQYKLADAILTCWVYICVVELRLSIDSCHFLCNPKFSRLLHGKYFPELISLLNKFDSSHQISILTSRFLGNINYLVQPSDTVRVLTPGLWVDYLYSVEDLEHRLKELLSLEIWEKLDDITKGDLLQAEGLFEQMRIRSKDKSDIRPERGFFNHYSVILERELKLYLEVILKWLEVHFETKPYDKDHGLSFLQNVINNGNYSLGTLFKLIQCRKNDDKLGKFPELLDALEKSEIVSSIFSDKNLRIGFENIPIKYRNPAVHANDRILTLEDAHELRGIVFGQDLLRRVFICRIFHPLEFD